MLRVYMLVCGDVWSGSCVAVRVVGCVVCRVFVDVLGVHVQLRVLVCVSCK